MTAATVPVSVLIPTKDEERNIAACIESVAWADDIVVLDSHSTDRTVEIAEAHGARVVKRVFDDFATHKNWAIDTIAFRNPWLLIVDADEKGSAALAREIMARTRAEPHNGYFVPILVHMWNRPIRCHYPVYNLRLIRLGKARYERRIVHEHMIVEGTTGYLKNHLLNADDKGIERYIDRHNTYSSFEAVETYRLLHGLADEGKIEGSVWRRGPARNRVLKNFAYRHLPARALFVFLWFYVVKRGFLDGRAGFRYCLLRLFYEYEVSLKLKELEDPHSPMREKYGRYLAD